MIQDDVIILSSKKPPEEERRNKGKYFYSYGITAKDLDKISRLIPQLAAIYRTRELNNRTVFTKAGKNMNGFCLIWYNYPLPNTKLEFQNLFFCKILGISAFWQLPNIQQIEHIFKQNYDGGILIHL